MAVHRVLRTSKASLSRVFYLDEVPTEATGDVSVTVARLDGTTYQGPVTATGPDDDEVYSFVFDGADDLDEFVVTWTLTINGDALILDQDTIEVVGGYLVGLTEIRGADPKLKDTARYPTATLKTKRTWVENEFEGICGQSFVPRYARETLSGDGSGTLILGHPRLRRVRSISVAGTALGVSEVDGFGADLLGLLRRKTAWPVGTGNVVVEYEHGMDRVPVGISEVAAIRVKSRLFTTAGHSPLPDRAERIVTTDLGVVTLAIPSQEQTGIPEVDAELARWPSPRPRFG